MPVCASIIFCSAPLWRSVSLSPASIVRCEGVADPEHGARRNGTPFINAQPRFGIYRDWRAETQTIYFDKIMFWNANPGEHPDWGVSPPPG